MKNTFLEHFLSLSPPVFSSQQAASAFTSCFCFYIMCLAVYQLPKSVGLLLADEVSMLLYDPVTRSARLCVLGTRGAVWRWPLTLIKGSTALFGSYQFNQLALCCSLPIHGRLCPSVPACGAHSSAHTLLLLQWAIHSWISQKTSFLLKGRATDRKLSFISETQRSVLFLNLCWQFKVMFKL